MKFLFLFLSSIFLQTSLINCSNRRPNRLQSRYTSMGQNEDGSQACTLNNDNNPYTNMFKCKNERGPLDLNDCQTAGRFMMENNLSSAGFQTCGVFYLARNRDDTLALVKLPEQMNATAIENIINFNAIECCPENMPIVKPPIIINLAGETEQSNYLATGLVISTYTVPTELTEEDIKSLLKENVSNGFVYHFD
ncbi:hypothetical protein DFH28DRAFT_91268 [Melampsora americana]|nr:hypothetical protein DFH28DRAFT_91268 [Melampsora americana]